jgi:hypothetical protein
MAGIMTKAKRPFVQIFKIWPPEGKFGGFKIVSEALK